MMIGMMNKEKRIDKIVSDYVVFDLETTGTSTANDEVVEISAVKVRNGTVVDEFTSLVNPQCPISYGASRVNHITDAMVENAPLFRDVLGEFLDFAGNDVLVGHNIYVFDMRFIYRDAKKYYGTMPENEYIDTLVLARNFLPQLDHHKLVDLAAYYGISSAGAHRALNDCRMNQQIYECLAKEYEAIKNGERQMKLCPECGRVMKKRNGKFGEFLGCSGYPGCRHTEKILQERKLL